MPHPNPTQLDKRLLWTRQETADALRIKPWYLDQLRNEGRIAAVQLGRRVMFDPQEVARFANELPAWEPK